MEGMPEARPVSNAALPFHSIMPIRVFNRQVMPEEPLCKFPPWLWLDLWELRVPQKSGQDGSNQMSAIRNWFWKSGQAGSESPKWDEPQELGFSFSRGWQDLSTEQTWWPIACTHFWMWRNATLPLHPVTREGYAAKAAHQNAVIFLHLLVPLLFTLVYLGLVTMAMLILRYWWLIMIITALGFFLLSFKLTYSDH